MLEKIKSKLIARIAGERTASILFVRITAETGEISAICIISAKWYKKEKIRINDCEIEIQWTQFDRLIHKIKKERDDYLINFVRRSEVWYDKNNLAAEIIELSKDMFAAGPKKQTASGRAECISKIINIEKSVRRTAADNPLTALHLTQSALREIIEIYFKLQGWRPVGTTRQLFELRRRDPYIYEFCEKITTSSAADIRINLFLKLCAAIKENFSGETGAGIESVIRRNKLDLTNVIKNPGAFFIYIYKKILLKNVYNDKFENVYSFSKFIAPYWRFYLIAFAGDVIIMALTLPAPFLLKMIFDKALPQLDYSLLNILFIIIVCFICFRYLFMFLKNYYVTFITERMWAEIQLKFYDKLLSFPFRFYDGNETGDIVFRFKDAESAFNILSKIIFDIFEYSIYLIVFPLIFFIINPMFGGIAVLFIPLYILVYYFMSKLIAAHTESITAKRSKLSAKQYESIHSVKTIQALGIKKAVFSKLEKIIETIRFQSVTLFTIIDGGKKINNIISSALFFGAVYFASVKVFGGEMTIGDMYFFVFMFAYLIKPILGILEIGVQLQILLVWTSRFFEIYNTAPEADDKDAKSFEQLSEDIKFENIFFGYNEQSYVLKNASFKMPLNKITAITGKSGAGKSTIINLLMRFYDYSGGEIKINGEQLFVYTIQSLRKKIGYAAQSDFLFSGSLKENICIGIDNITEEDIEYALKISTLDKVIENFNDGINAEIGEDGTLLSGGEKKRVTIARAILRNPEIYIFDEALSQLDSETEDQIYESLCGLSGAKTIIFTAHQLSAIKKADHIIFLSDDNKIFEGGFDYLYSECAEFKKMLESQLRI